MKRFALTVLILLSLPTWQSFAQTSQASPPISKQDWMASNVDLGIVKAQLAAYRQALQQALSERDNLQAQLNQHSTDSALQSQAQQAELSRLTKQLSDLNSTISALESSSASALQRQQELLDKADNDHKAEVSSYAIRVRIWRAVALTASGAAAGALVNKGDIGTAGIGAGSGLALDLILEAFGQ